jgi:hypothetical protein
MEDAVPENDSRPLWPRYNRTGRYILLITPDFHPGPDARKSLAGIAVGYTLLLGL